MDLQLGWTSPIQGEAFGPLTAGAVPLELSVTRLDGGAFTGTVPYELTGRATGTLSLAGGLWRGTVDAGFDSGSRTLTAGWTGGPMSQARSFDVLVSPPAVTLYPQAPPTRAVDDTDSDMVARWKKSEEVPVQVESNRLLAPIVATDFMGPGVRLAPMASACTRPCGTPFCVCFLVDLAQRPLVAAAGSIHGTVAVQLQQATDTLGNVATNIAPVSLPVTRLKWRRTVSSGLGEKPTAVAVAPSGRVVVGASANVTSTLKAFEPDGGTAWTNTNAAEVITSGPLVGTLGVYFGVANATAGSIRQVSVANGGSAVNRCGILAENYPGDIALVNPGASEAVVAVRSDGLISPTTPMCIPSPIAGATAISSSNRPTLIVSGTSAFVAMSGSAPVWKFDGAGANSPSPAGSVSTQTLFPSNLFSTGTGIVGGGGGPTVGGTFAFQSAGTIAGNTTNSDGGTSPGGPAILGEPTSTNDAPVYYGDSGGALNRLQMTPTPAFTPPARTTRTAVSFRELAPLLGRGGHLYAVGSNGSLLVLNATTMAEEWRWDAALPSTGLAQLTLDKNRDASSPCGPSQPGVLYVAAPGSEVRLYAVLVDSAGFDITAAWPRYQHDPANTGNAGTDLSPWSCP